MNKFYVYCLIIFIPFISATHDYEESFVYNHMFEPFLELDSIIDGVESFQVTHCSVLDDQGSWVDYRSLGNCLYSQIPFFEENEQSLKEVIVHIETYNEEKFNFSIKWKDFSLTDVWGLYMSDSNESLIGAQVVIESETEPVNDFLRSVWKLNQQKNGIDKPSLDGFDLIIFNELADIYKLQLKVHSLDQGQNAVELRLEFQDQEGHVLFSRSIETNYYIGADNFFVQSGK